MLKRDLASLKLQPLASTPIRLTLLLLLEAGSAMLDGRFSRSWPVAHLYYLPIALGGAFFGFSAAVPLSLLSAAIFVTIDFGYLTRAVTEADVIRLLLFMAVGIVASVLRRNSRHLAEAAQELRSVNEKLSEMNTRLEHEQELRVQYVARAAHDVAQPLTAMKAAADLLRHQYAPKADFWEDELRGISANCTRTANMLENLIDAARMTGAGIRIQLGDVDIKALIREVIQALGASRDRSIELESEEFIPLIRGDRGKLLRVFINILGNALKYSPSSSPIHVCVSCDPPIVRVTVRDHGVGISEQDLRVVFQPFVRASSVERSEGFGLGLAISREIVSQHHGEMAIDSTVAKGTAVHVFLPIGGP